MPDQPEEHLQASLEEVRARRVAKLASLTAQDSVAELHQFQRFADRLGLLPGLVEKTAAARDEKADLLPGLRLQREFEGRPLDDEVPGLQALLQPAKGG